MIDENNLLLLLILRSWCENLSLIKCRRSMPGLCSWTVRVLNIQ